MSGPRPMLLGCILLVQALLGLPTTFAADTNGAAFDEAQDLFKRGRIEESLQKFREVLAANPSNEDALAMWDRAGRDVFVPMLLREGEASTIARRFAELAKVSRKEKAGNADAIKALVEQVITGDYRAQRDAMNKLIADHGGYAVEYLYPYLADQDHLEARVNAIMALTKLGGDAVLPLIQVLKSSNDAMRANAAAVLGMIGDGRATPSLTALLTGDKSEMVREQAGVALKKMNGMGAGAAQLYQQHAMDYIMGEPTVVRPYLSLHVIWSWAADQLTKKEVSPALFPVEMARQSALEALRLEPGQPDAQAAYVVACAAEKAELQAAKNGGGPDLGVDADALSAQVDTVLGLAGPETLSIALTATLDLNDAPTSAVLIEALGRAKASGPVLQRALESRDKLIRYPAALALANAGQNLLGVVQVLMEAVAEDAVRNVVVIDDQDDSRNAMVSALADKGYNVVWASSGPLGLSRALSFPTKDVVIVRSDMRDMTLDGIVRSMKDNPRTQSSAILVVASRARLEEEQKLYEGKVAGFIESGSPASAFLPQLEAALPPLNPERVAATSVSAHAARALAHMDAQALGPAVDSLVATLEGRPNELREPALWALATVGPPAAAKPAAAILADAANPKELRLAATRTLQAVMHNSSADVVEATTALTDALKADDVELRRAAADALGAAQFLTPAQRAELILAHPVQ